MRARLDSTRLDSTRAIVHSPPCIWTELLPAIFSDWGRPSFLLPCLLLCIPNYGGEFRSRDNRGIARFRLNFQLKPGYRATMPPPPPHPRALFKPFPAVCSRKPTFTLRFIFRSVVSQPRTPLCFAVAAEFSTVAFLSLTFRLKMGCHGMKRQELSPAASICASFLYR